MKRLVFIVVLALIASTIAANSGRISKPVSGDMDAESPRLLRMIPDAPYPIWVDAASAVDSNNFVHGEYFSDGGEVLKEWMKIPQENGCIPIGISQPSQLEEHPQRRESLQAAVESSQWIVQGKVMAESPGFHGYVPGTLLTIHVTKTLKGDPAPSTIYAFLPVGRVPVGTEQICKSDSTYISVPRVGDSAILFTPGFSGENHRLAIVMQGGDIIGVHRDGHLILPLQYSSDPGANSIRSLGDLNGAVVAVSKPSGGEK